MMQAQNTNNTNGKRFTILKKVAKHGKQSVIVVPKMLEEHLKPGTMMQLTIDVLENPIKIEGAEEEA